jgi:hypothetical protein
MRFLGIRTGPDRPSDEEYIESVRKRLRSQRWLRYFQAVIGLLLMVGCIWAIPIMFRILMLSGPSAQQQNLIYMTFVLAGMFGFVIGLFLLKAMLHIGEALFERRKDQMLVESWDAMNILLAEREKERSGKP